jgi:hypothetical protein
MKVVDAIAVWRDGGRVQVLRQGHAEIWNDKSEAIGYLVTKDVARFIALGGRVYKSDGFRISAER